MKHVSTLRAAIFFTVPFLFLNCNGQSRKKATNEDLENIIHSNFRLPAKISAIDTSAGWNQNGQKLLLTGVVVQQDGITPAPDVVLYYYQTNVEGRYVHKPDEERSMPPNKLGQTHGYIRGRVKTDSDGRYFIYTVRPGSYPSRTEPAHVHVTVKEPNSIKEYYIDDFVFDDDMLLTTTKRRKMENRGGSGVLRTVQRNNLVIGERNIILGLNIPDYPTGIKTEMTSGKNVGEDVFSFTPFHAWGPDKGTQTCPICKYGWYNGVLYFVGNKPDWNDVKQWLTFLETESQRRAKYLKVYFVYGNETGYTKGGREAELARLGTELKLEKIALTFVTSFSDEDSEVHLNKINPDVDNTFIIYKRGKVIGNYINLKPGKQSFDLISRQLDQSVNEYFDLPRAKP